MINQLVLLLNLMESRQKTKEQEHLAIIQRLYQQQKEMFINHRHRTDKFVTQLEKGCVCLPTHPFSVFCENYFHLVIVEETNL
jgi:hypothetical protein